MTNTFEGFLTAVKQQYEVSKNGIYAGFLLNPSPAQLRNLCLLLLENNLSRSDEETFRVFFQVSDGAVLRRCVENFDIEKFKAIGNFLKGKSEKTNAVSLNLISILVDYQPRPYNKYLKTNTNSNVEVVTKGNNDIQGIETFVYELFGSTSKEDDAVKSVSIRLLSSIAVFVLLFFASVYIINHAFFPEKECMQWQNDHYETVDCNVVKQGIATLNEVMPINEREIHLKRIEVNKESLFFKNGKPQIWYGKINGKMYYFNSYGTNPETGKPLKPITEYMVKKYVMK
jgi:hypothetical protein